MNRSINWHNNIIPGGWSEFFRPSWEATNCGGSIRIDGSHSPGGMTVTESKNSSIPATKCFELEHL